MIRSQNARQWRCATAGHHVGSVCATLGRHEELPIRVHRAPLRRVRKTRKAGVVVTMHPVTQRLPVDTIGPRRLGPVVTLQHQGKHQHPPPPPHAIHSHPDPSAQSQPSSLPPVVPRPKSRRGRLPKKRRTTTRPITVKRLARKFPPCDWKRCPARQRARLVVGRCCTPTGLSVARNVRRAAGASSSGAKWHRERPSSTPCSMPRLRRRYCVSRRFGGSATQSSVLSKTPRGSLSRLISLSSTSRMFAICPLASAPGAAGRERQHLHQGPLATTVSTESDRIVAAAQRQGSQPRGCLTKAGLLGENILGENVRPAHHRPEVDVTGRTFTAALRRIHSAVAPSAAGGAGLRTERRGRAIQH